MSESRLISWEWLAGFTDGDGHIRVIDPREHVGRVTGAWVRVGWTQAEANIATLDAIEAFFERERVVRFRTRFSVASQGHVYPQLELAVARQDDAYDVLCRLLPHLVLKHGIAAHGIEVLDLIRRATRQHGRRSWLRELRAAA